MVNKKKRELTYSIHATHMSAWSLLGHCWGRLWLCRPVIEMGMIFVTVGPGIPASGSCFFRQRKKNFTLGFDLDRYWPHCIFYKRNEEVL